MLGKKQSIDNWKWKETFCNIESLISKAEVDDIAAKTVEQITQTLKGKKAAYAWSGGKDSLVLGKLCEAAGVTDCMIGICDLEYPDFIGWLKQNAPKGIEVINTHQDLKWLSRHKEMLFPQSSAAAARWFSIVQHTAQRKYYQKHKIDMLLLGRRIADGNYVGRGSNCYTDKNGVTRYSPISDWKHEEVLGYIYYYQLKLPPFYDWDNGFICGTHPWPARQWTGSVENGWKEVYRIDPKIVRHAAKYLSSAAAFLKGGIN